MLTNHLLLKGKVQGVFYRANAKKQAEKLNITGWIKNTNEGHVEAVITGKEDAVEQFIKWCRQGSERAQVEEIKVSDKEETDFKEFTIIR